MLGMLLLIHFKAIELRGLKGQSQTQSASDSQWLNFLPFRYSTVGEMDDNEQPLTTSQQQVEK